MHTDAPHVVAIGGSQRDGSYTHLALDHVLAAAEAAGATTDHVDVATLDLPLFDPDDPDAGDAAELRERVGAADAIVLGTPMYHGSYSSVLKTALDYLGAEQFQDRTVGLLAVSGGAFPLAALDHLRAIGRSLGAWVLPHQAAIPTARSAFDGRRLVDDATADRVAELGEQLVRYAAIEASPLPADDPSATQHPHRATCEQ